MTAASGDWIAVLPTADSPLWGLVAAVMGGVAGRLLTASVGGLLDSGLLDEADQSGPPRAAVDAGARKSRRWIEVAVVAAAVALWWWEVRCRGVEPEWTGGGWGPVSSPQAAAVLLRSAAHAVLGLLLAAAAWIDLRYRVIPDSVTVPGVLLGLVAVWLIPDVLLPIAHEVPRAYAPALIEADVLGWYGGLRTQRPPLPFDGAPHLPGLVLAWGIFSLWWFVCTAPFRVAPQAAAAAGCMARWRTAWQRVEPRTLILVAGLSAIAAAWYGDGDHFRGLLSGLVGLAVSAGLVWSIREGASRSLGREAMGLGDVTLMAMVGAWLGWQASVLTFFLAAFIGLAHGLLQVVRHRENELPYGPSLCLACAGVVVGWRPLWAWAGGPFLQPLELSLVIAAVVVLTAVTLFVWQRLRG